MINNSNIQEYALLPKFDKNLKIIGTQIGIYKSAIKGNNMFEPNRNFLNASNFNDNQIFFLDFPDPAMIFGDKKKDYMLLKCDTSEQYDKMMDGDNK